MFKIFEQNLIEIAKDIPVFTDEMNLDKWVIQAFVRTYNELPRIINCSDGLKNETSAEDFKYSITAETISLLINNKFKNTGIDVEKSLKNICSKYPDSIEIRIRETRPIIYNDKFIIVIDYGVVLFHQNEIIHEVFKCFAPIENKQEAAVYHVSKGNFGFETYPFTINVKDIDGNYNDDLPLEKIHNIINSKDSSIILFNGVPGGGKSSLIRYIIDQYKTTDIKFLYLDSNVFNYISDSAFIQFIIRFKDSVIILEDCEKLLKSRESGDSNGLISNLLNISDGLLGDSLNLKFICTFNTDLTNIDKAITRKGRLKLKYEFKPLCKEKVAKIFEKRGIDPKLAKDMTLAEVYNFEEDNGVTDNRKRVGF